MTIRLILMTQLLIWLTFGAVAPIRAAEPETADLLFSASFDRLTAFADYARGNPESTLDASLELRAKPGIKGHCLLVTEGEQCIYDAAENLDLAAGTISFWVKPVNWSDDDRRYVAFLNVFGREKKTNKGFGLSIDTSDTPESARTHISLGSRSRDPDYKLYLALGKAEWNPQTWHKLDVTWDAKHLAIYVDGVLSNRQPLIVNDTLEIPDLSWVGSGVGISDEVLEPWTPLEYHGDRAVECWGRRYEFSGPLPSLAVHQGSDLLREPVTLTLKTASGIAVLKEEEREKTVEKPNLGRFQGTSRFPGVDAEVEWQSSVEYDGLILSSFTIDPPTGGLDLESLTMTIPLMCCAPLP